MGNCRGVVMCCVILLQMHVCEVIWTHSLRIKNPKLRETNTADTYHRFDVRLG